MNETSIEKIEKNVIKAFLTKTPSKYIKSRPGAGGRTFRYVETSYVVNELNKMFGLLWTWRIVDKKVSDKSIWLQGELSVPLSPEVTVIKTGFGGSKIKMSSSTGEPIDESNDLKAASTLALKKAASLFGIASDIYYPEMDWYEEIAEVEELDEPKEEDIANHTHNILMRKMFAMASEKGLTEEDIDKVINLDYNLDSKKNLTNGQLQELIGRIENKQ